MIGCDWRSKKLYLHPVEPIYGRVCYWREFNLWYFVVAEDGAYLGYKREWGEKVQREEEEDWE